jgi:hypothetical protein
MAYPCLCWIRRVCTHSPLYTAKYITATVQHKLIQHCAWMSLSGTMKAQGNTSRREGGP